MGPGVDVEVVTMVRRVAAGEGIAARVAIVRTVATVAAAWVSAVVAVSMSRHRQTRSRAVVTVADQTAPFVASMRDAAMAFGLAAMRAVVTARLAVSKQAAGTLRVNVRVVMFAGRLAVREVAAVRERPALKVDGAQALLVLAGPHREMQGRDQLARPPAP